MSWRSSSAGVDERERQGAHHLTHGGRRRPMGETGAALPLRASPQSASETRSSSSSADCAASPAPAGRVGTSAVSADARHSEGSTGKFTLHRSPARSPLPALGMRGEKAGRPAPVAGRHITVRRHPAQKERWVAEQAVGRFAARQPGTSASSAEHFVLFAAPADRKAAETEVRRCLSAPERLASRVQVTTVAPQRRSHLSQLAAAAVGAAAALVACFPDFRDENRM